MAALTSPRDTSEIAGGGKLLVLPVKAGAAIYQGAIVALDANGYAVPGQKAADITAAGRAEETVINSGADGEVSVKVLRGVFVFDNSEIAANKITQAHVLKPCYIQDEQTVTALAADASVCGRVIRVDAGGVAVEIGSAAID